MKEFTLENYPAKNLSLENMEGEIWRDIQGYDGSYSISNYGRVKSEDRINDRGHHIKARILVQGTTKTNVMFVVLCLNGVPQNASLNKLVGEAFVGLKDEGQVYSHKNKKWFDNTADNIEILSYSESNLLSYEKGNSTWAIGTGYQNKYKYIRLSDNKVFTCPELIKEYNNSSCIDHNVRVAIKNNTLCRGSKWERIEIKP